MLQNYVSVAVSAMKINCPLINTSMVFLYSKINNYNLTAVQKMPLETQVLNKIPPFSKLNEFHHHVVSGTLAHDERNRT